MLLGWEVGARGLSGILADGAATLREHSGTKWGEGRIANPTLALKASAQEKK